MYQIKSFYTIFFISVLLLSFGTFAEANINYYPTDAIPEITGSGSFEMEQEITTGKRRWKVAGGPEASITISVSAYGLGYGQGTLTSITILGQTFPQYEDPAIEVGSKTSKGKWVKGTNTIKTVISRPLAGAMPGGEDSYDWEAEGQVVLTPYAWKESVTAGGGLRWPLQIQGTFSTTGTWEGQTSKDITRSAASGTTGAHDLKLTYYCSTCGVTGDTPESIGGKEAHALVTCERPGCGEQYYKCNKKSAKLHSIPAGSDQWNCDLLSVLFNKTTFTYDEELVVTIQKEGIQSAHIKLDGQLPILDPTPDAPDKIIISTGLSHLDFSASNKWYGKVTVTVNYDSNGTTQQESVEQYISVSKKGYSANSSSFSAYGTYEAAVFDTEPIKKVYWYLKKPGDRKYKKVKHDKVKGGLSSSLSYSLGSTSGEYKVNVVIYLDVDRPLDNIYSYVRSFYVY